MSLRNEEIRLALFHIRTRDHIKAPDDLHQNGNRLKIFFHAFFIELIFTTTNFTYQLLLFLRIRFGRNNSIILIFFFSRKRIREHTVYHSPLASLFFIHKYFNFFYWKNIWDFLTRRNKICNSKACFITNVKKNAIIKNGAHVDIYICLFSFHVWFLWKIIKSKEMNRK